MSQSATAIGTMLIAKIQRHEPASSSRPPKSGPMTIAIPDHAVHEPMAAPRSPGSKRATMSPSVFGTSSAPAIPWSPRKATRTPIDGAAAQSTLATPNPTRPTVKARRRPKRSPSEPPTSSRAPSVSR